jgi:hypothetical protein
VVLFILKKILNFLIKLSFINMFLKKLEKKKNLFTENENINFFISILVSCFLLIFFIISYKERGEFTIKSTSNKKLFDILDKREIIKNKDLEAYLLKSYSENTLINKLLKNENKFFYPKVEIASIIINNMPSSALREIRTIENDEQRRAQNIIIDSMNANLKYKNYTLITDYWDDNCEGINIFNKYKEKYPNNIIDIKRAKKTDQTIKYGYYVLIKFKSKFLEDKYYLIDSKGDHQIDKKQKINENEKVAENTRNFVVLTKNEIKDENNKYYDFFQNLLKIPTLKEKFDLNFLD